VSDETPQNPEVQPRSTVNAYWREFWRVNFDKIVLWSLTLVFVAVGADERLVYASLGALASAMTHNRWQRNP
jgi:hypothetical protein